MEQKGVSLQGFSKCTDFHTLYNEPPITLEKISSNPHPLLCGHLYGLKDELSRRNFLIFLI